MADLDSLKPAASMVVFLVQHTNESTDCLVPGLVHLLVVVRAVEDLVVVPESQVSSPAWVNLAKGHGVLHVVVSVVAAYFAVVDLEVAYPHRQPRLAVQLEVEAVSLVEGLLLEQVGIVLAKVSAPVSAAAPVAGHRALLWLSPA